MEAWAKGKREKEWRGCLLHVCGLGPEWTRVNEDNLKQLPRDQKMPREDAKGSQ